MDKVSVIVPIYNTGKYLPKCLDSIICQTYQNLEIILIDDGSTDSSSKVIDDYAKKDKRIVAVRQKNAGQSSARNHGIALSTGDYLSFVDSDDLLKPTFLESLLNLYKKTTSIAVCGHEFRRIKEGTVKNLYTSPLKPRKKSESKKSFILKLLAKDGRMYSCNNKLFRADVIKKHNLRFDEKLNFAEDTKFVLDYLKYAPGEIAYTPDSLYIYNSGTDTSTMKTVATDWRNWQTSYNNLKSWLGPHPSLRESFWLHLVYLRWRISHFKQLRRAKNSTKPSKKQSAKRVGKYTIIGIILTIFNFLIYTLLARVVINNNELLWLDSMISYIAATFLAYFLHSKITWKERTPSKSGIFKFFAWNIITALLISPFFTWFFGLITPLYHFVFDISSAIHLPFDYAFIESTGIFGLTTLITMILNYLCYDRLVFGKTK